MMLSNQLYSTISHYPSDTSPTLVPHDNPVSKIVLRVKTTSTISNTSPVTTNPSILKFQDMIDDISDDSDEESDNIDSPYIYSNHSSEYTNCHVVPKLSQRTILQDLEKIDIPDIVKKESERIFQELKTSTKRGRRRKKLLFYCIFNAYNLLGKPQDPKIIAELVGISPTEITKSFSMCSESQTKYRPPTVFHSPVDFIPQYLKDVGLDDGCLDAVTDLADRILNKEPELKENYPQVVAAGILLYYMTINGVEVNKKEYAKIIRRSEMTISKMFKRIWKIDNDA